MIGLGKTGKVKIFQKNVKLPLTNLQRYLIIVKCIIMDMCALLNGVLFKGAQNLLLICAKKRLTLKKRLSCLHKV